MKNNSILVCYAATDPLLCQELQEKNGSDQKYILTIFLIPFFIILFEQAFNAPPIWKIY